MAKGAFGLGCRECGEIFPGEQHMQLVRAHFLMLHGVDKIDLDLVVLCPKCEKSMEHLATIGEEHHYQCEPCHRGRVIKQRQVV